MAEIKTIFKFKRANADQWPNSYLLEAGEPGFELDTKKLKIGDGHTTWINLPYLNGQVIINTDGSLTYNDNTLSINGFQAAATGTIPQKTHAGALTWIQPLVASDVEGIIQDSDDVNNWVEQKIENVTSRVYRGTASEVLESNEGVITLYDSNFVEIDNADPGDVYSYNDNGVQKRYLWTGEEWVEITGQEIYATKREINTINGVLASLQTRIATTSEIGNVKSSTDVNTISVDNNGVMNINTISTDKLVDNENVELVLNAGNAGINN